MTKLNKKIVILGLVLLIVILAISSIFLFRPDSEFTIKLTTESAQNNVEVSAAESPESTKTHRIIDISLKTDNDELKTDKKKSTDIKIKDTPYTVTLLSPDFEENDNPKNKWTTAYSYDSEMNQLNIIHNFTGDHTNSSQPISNTYKFN